MRVLITGGFGYLGGRLGKFLVSFSEYKVILGSRKNIEPSCWPPQVRAVQTIWSSDKQLEEICQNVDAIVHMAGMNAHDCAKDPVSAIECNTVATTRLVRAAIRAKVKRFIYSQAVIWKVFFHEHGSELKSFYQKGFIFSRPCP